MKIIAKAKRSSDLQISNCTRPSAHSSYRACLRRRSKSNRTLQKCPCPSLPRPPSRSARSRACPGTLRSVRVASTRVVSGANPARFLIHRERQREQDADMPHQRVRMCAPRERRARSLSIATDPHRRPRPRFPSPQVRPLLQGQEVRSSPRARPSTPNQLRRKSRVGGLSFIARCRGYGDRIRARDGVAMMRRVVRGARRVLRRRLHPSRGSVRRPDPVSDRRRACPRSRWGPQSSNSPPGAHKSHI